jgi:DDE superfamily endonuclease/Helix-turn-helix of DDE superfamily endonuclease
LRSKRTTGLSAEQFLALCELVTEAVGTWQPTTGRPRALSLNKAVKVTVMYLKNNITQEVIGELLTVSQPTVSRVITELEPIIGDVLDGYVPDLATEVTGRVAVVDGTLCPCWSWADAPELYSGKHKTTGHNHQLVCDLTGTLLHISDPVDGRTHDTKAITDTGLLTTLDATNTIGDKGLPRHRRSHTVPQTSRRRTQRMAERVQHHDQQDALGHRTSHRELQNLALHAYRLPMPPTHLSHDIPCGPSTPLLQTTL